MFAGVKGGRYAAADSTSWAAGLHVHDLRHAGNTLAADTGISLRNLMAHMGHHNGRAALIYQHKCASADRPIAEGLDGRSAPVEPHRPAATLQEPRPSNGPYPANPPNDQGPGERFHLADLDLHMRASDGNRTRIISLGMIAASGPD